MVSLHGERLNRLVDWVRNIYAQHQDPAHDFAHIERVRGYCQWLGTHYQADFDVLIPAALLHDVVNLPKDHQNRAEASQQAALEGGRILEKLGFEATVIARIQTVVTEHAYSRGLSPSCIESAILQDADRLDALGALGILRMATCGAKLGSRYYHPEEPIAHDRPLDDRRYLMDHFFTKLFGLGDRLNTALAKEEGRRRIAFMKTFVSQIQMEIQPIDSL